MYTRVLGTVDSIGVQLPGSPPQQDDPFANIRKPPPPPTASAAAKQEDKSWWEYGLEALARGMSSGPGGKYTPGQQIPVQQQGMPAWVLPAVVGAGLVGVILYTRK